MSTILVIGATGKVGSALVSQMQEAGLPFRALAHTPASRERLEAQGVATVTADTSSAADLDAAFAGIDRLFLLTPSSPDQFAIERALVDAARRAGVRQVVKLSVLAAGDPDVPILGPHRESEEYIRRSGLGHTFLRPNNFMQNLAAVDAITIRQRGAIMNSAGEGRISFIDTRDIAAVALAALRDERHLGQTYDLTGPAALTYGEVADKLTALLDRPVRYLPLGDEEYRGGLEAAGLPGWYADGLARLYWFYREGRGAAVTDTVVRITGRPARTLDAYLTEELATFAQ